MKLKRFVFVFFIAIGLVSLMSTTCSKDDQNDPNGGTCTGSVSAKTTGNLTADYCFDVLVSYEYVTNQSLSLVCRQDGDPIYSCSISLNASNGNFTGPGTYNCGFDEVGYVELDIHGNDNEYYKAQSGTITITEVDETHFVGSFSVSTIGYYNGKTVSFTGTINKQ